MSRRWRRLKNWPGDRLPIGTIFRLPMADYQSHESPLDLMLVKHLKYEHELWWMVVSGYKAGLTLLGGVPSGWIADDGPVKFIWTRVAYKEWRRRVYPSPRDELRVNVGGYPPGMIWPTTRNVLLWHRLDRSADARIDRGSVLRARNCAVVGFEPTVDLMLMENNDSPSRYSLLVTTGRRVGHVLCDLPQEALFPGLTYAMSAHWLARHWRQAVIDSPPEAVRVIGGYPPGVRIDRVKP